MTIRGTEKIIAHDPVEKHIDKRTKRVWCIETGEPYDSVKVCAKSIGVHYQTLINHLNNKRKSVHGLHYCYEEDIAKYRDMSSAQIAKSNTENEKLRAENEKLRAKSDKERAEREELERKAALWDAYQKEQEAIRKAEEERQQKVEKLKARIERRKRIADNLNTQYQAAIRRIMEDEKELAELEGAK